MKTPQDNKPDMGDKLREGTTMYARYSGLAIQMLVVIGGGVWGGIKLDEKLGLAFPAFTVGLSLLGVCLTLYLVYKNLQG